MKAVIQNRYGAADTLSVQEQPIPKPLDHQVLLRVKAVSVNDFDWSLITGRPFLYRLMFGLLKPKTKVAGIECAGVIASCGSSVKDFTVGDRVYGDISAFGFGAFTQFLKIDHRALKLMPDHLKFEQAAAIPHAALLAWQGLRLANLGSGEKLLINGAGGGVGFFAQQYAKTLGCQTIGIDSVQKLSYLTNLDFDETFDYERHDFTKKNLQLDVIIDAKTNRPFWHYLRALKSGGIYVTVGGELGKIFQILLVAPFLKFFSRKKLKILALRPNEGLEEVANWLARDTEVPIDGPFALEETRQAIARFGRAEHCGKVVIKIDHDSV